MSRVALVGEGPAPGTPSAETGFPALRLGWFQEALSDHDVEFFDARAPVDRASQARAQRCDFVVAAGAHAPTRLALQLVDDQPLWIDLPGDPFAGAQPTRIDEDEGTRDALGREAAATFLPALARGDAFSTLSGRSRYALLGQLGALGRLAHTRPGEEWAWVMPAPWAFGHLPEAPRRTTITRRNVLLAGSMDPWFDGETTLAALVQMLDTTSSQVQVTGGPLSDGDQFLRFRAAALGSRHADRFLFHGWVEANRLGVIAAECDVLLCLDRPGFEPELGGRTRLLFALHQGLCVVATPSSELAEQLVLQGFVHRVPVGDPEAAARALAAVGPPPSRAALRTRYRLEDVMAPLRAWAKHPGRRQPAAEAGALLDLVHERDALIREIEHIRNTPTWRLLNRLVQVRKR